jgi:hypothetical protein
MNLSFSSETNLPAIQPHTSVHPLPTVVSIRDLDFIWPTNIALQNALRAGCTAMPTDLLTAITSQAETAIVGKAPQTPALPTVNGEKRLPPRRRLQKEWSTNIDKAAGSAFLNTQPDNVHRTARIYACRGSGSASWLCPIATHLRDIWFSNAEFLVASRLRLGLQITSDKVKCAFCETEDDSYGTHILACSRGGVRHKMHTTLRKAVHLVAGHAHAQPRAEVLVPGTLQDRVDILLSLGGKTIGVDVSITFPLAGSNFRLAASKPDAQLEAVADMKERKYAQHCRAAGYHFVPLVCDTYGSIEPRGAALVRSLAHAWGKRCDVHMSRASQVVTQWISVQTVKAAARQLLEGSRLEDLPYCG